MISHPRRKRLIENDFQFRLSAYDFWRGVVKRGSGAVSEEAPYGGKGSNN
jgi:hypothetical protein